MSNAEHPCLTWIHQAANHPDLRKHVARRSLRGGTTVFSHVTEASQAFFVAVLHHLKRSGNHSRLWVVCDSPRQRERLAIELELWKVDAITIPEAPVETSEGTVADPESGAEWLACLQEVATSADFVILCAPAAFSERAPSPSSLTGSASTLQTGGELNPKGFVEALSKHGYEKSPTVTTRGQFSVRGGIVDVFTWNSPKPLRFEFFDTEVESIREFDVDSQASVRKLSEVVLQLTEPDLDATVGDYRQSDDALVSIGIEDPNADFHLSEGAEEGAVEEDFSLASFTSPFGTMEAGDFVLEEARRDRFFEQINDWKRDGWEIALVFSNKGEQERFTELAGADLHKDLGVTPVRGELLSGFTLPLTRLAVLSSSELFGRYRTTRKRRSSLERARSIQVRGGIDEMEEGDLVIHYEYGLAKFRGIEKGEEGEELTLEYRDGMLLSVPLEQAHLVGKYVGMGGKTPQLTKLGGSSWRSARKAAERSIADYAAQLLRVQAEREQQPGQAHPVDNHWMWEFEKSFHFTETVDQQRAIEETKRDMESPRPMDRLVCGDVGFGKTEVAIRAAFKAATGGKQVALLVPTTVLAEQHWRTFRERMSDYPLRIDLLNRFRSPSESRETMKGLANGAVDIVIGTHRLISGDISFKDLGLVIVDEEQRFGVAHKEKFKHFSRQIDILTLSATPIPRTLYMALMGARDMSTIDTPPPNRVPVNTTIAAYDEWIIRDAIRKEMNRGGQVFFLHNRVKSIEMMAKRLRELVPEARILVGHGQMHKDDLETIMHEFVRGEADVLLATTIIETGIDIPNANTILIDRADRFGLADLYQLRGRVGRAGDKAYAILLLPRDMITAGDARKRIHAIKEYTALGSGFKIAMKDLEIRGAGNLLGIKQSGHIAQIGFELYCQLLRQSVERLKGNGNTTTAETTFKADFLVTRETGRATGAGKESLPILHAYLPSSWIAETTLRIAAYRELARATSDRAIKNLEESWKDRFGHLPPSANHLLLISRIKTVAAGQGIASVEINGQKLMLHRNGDYILLEGRRFPRLKAIAPLEKIQETLGLLKTL